MDTLKQKITPFLWFEDQAEQAVDFYTDTFENSEVLSINRYREGPLQGKILTTVFQLEGQQFMALDGGPEFQFTPAVSFFVNCDTEKKIDELFKKLSDGGAVLMPLDKYPFGEKYAWVQDKFGVSWQLMLDPEPKQKIMPSVMFIGDQSGSAEEAAEFYTALFDDSEILFLSYYDEEDQAHDGKVAHGRFQLEGETFTLMDSIIEHHFSMTSAISFYVNCEDQQEVDKFWGKLSAGGEIQQCGWLTDKYGVTWQIIPKALPKMLNDPDQEKAKRAMDSMLTMKKIDIETIKQAYEGEKVHR